MNYNVSFQELAIMQQRILSKQRPTTLEKARKQVESLKNQSSQKNKKQRSWSAGSMNIICDSTNTMKAVSLPVVLSSGFIFTLTSALSTNWTIPFFISMARLFLQPAYPQLLFYTYRISANWILSKRWYTSCRCKATLHRDHPKHWCGICKEISQCKRISA